MLWEEAVDPQDALRTRFGFDTWPAAVDWVATALDDAWAITLLNCQRMVISERNAIAWVESSHGPLVLKWSSVGERFPTLAASASLLRHLGGQGLPVAAPIAAVDGRVRVVRDGPLGALSIAVLPEVAGDWLDVQDSAAVRSAGACLAQLHAALGDYADDGWSVRTDEVALADRLDQWLARHDPGRPPSAASRLRGLVRDLPPLDDERQLVHNDFRAANILTRGSVVVGILDFDDIVWAHRVSDLAKASVYLGTRFTDWRPTPASVRSELRAGYESVRPLGPAEAKWFDALVLWQAILAIPMVSDPAGWAAAV